MKDDRKWLALLMMIPLAMTSGCKEINNVNQMADDTSNMKKSTGSMDEKLSEMSGDTSVMKDAILTTRDALIAVKDRTQGLEDRTCTLFKDLRQGDSLRIREDTFDDGISHASSLEEKIGKAGIYYASFEFQLIDDQACDAPEARGVLYESAFTELFLSLTRYMPDPDIPVDPASTGEREQGLLALSAAIHQVNPNRAALDTRIGQPSVSVLSLLEATLKKAQDLETGRIKWEDLEAYERQILSNQKAAIRLLKTRSDFMPTMLLSKITPVKKRSWIGRAWMAYIGTRASFDDLTVGDLKNIVTWIEEADREIDYLRSIGQAFEINRNIKEFYKNLDLPEAGQSPADLRLAPGDRVVRRQTERQLLDEIHAFRKRVGAE